MAERSWEPFLTDADRAHLAVARPKVPCGFGERVAVLSVDNYRGAVGDRPEPLLEAIKTWPSSAGLAAWEALDKIAVLLAAARAARLPVIHVTGLAEEESGIPGWSSRRRPRTASADPAAEDRHRRRYDIVEQAAPMPGEVILKKTAPSAFFGTPMLAHLVAHRIDTLIVVGESVSGCVRATVVDGCSYRLRMIVVEECVYDRHEATRAMNLFDIDQKYGDVVSLGMTLDWIARQAPDVTGAGADRGLGHVHGHGDTSGHSPGHRHAHAHGGAEHGDAGGDVTTIPERVLADLPAGATAVSAVWHPVHGQALRRAGRELIQAVRGEITRAFGGSPHVIVELRDAEPGDSAALGAALAQTDGGLVMIGIGYQHRAPAPEGAHGAKATGGAQVTRANAKAGSPEAKAGHQALVHAQECPECGAPGAVDERVTRSNGEVADLLVCPECGAAWEANE